MRLVCAATALSACTVALAQDPDAIRAAMQPALEQQKASIQRQVHSAVSAPASPTGASSRGAAASISTASDQAVAAAPKSFFTVDWPAPPEFAAALTADPPDCDPLPEKDVNALVDAAAKEQGVKPELIHAVMEQESGFKPCAVSPKGAEGLMQLMPATADEFHVADPFDPVQNVGAGAKFLKTLLDKYGGDMKLALGAYNAGGAKVDQSGGVPNIQETQDYVTSILARLAKDAGASKSIAAPSLSGTGP